MTVTKPLLPWIFVGTQFKQIWALTYGVVTWAILKKSLSDFFQESLSARWIRREQLQLGQNLHGETPKHAESCWNDWISPAKFSRATVNVTAPLHKTLILQYYITQIQSRAPVIHESCKICSICCLEVSTTHRHLSESRWERTRLSKNMGGSVTLILFLNVGSSSSGRCRWFRPCVRLLIPAWMLSFLS